MGICCGNTWITLMLGKSDFYRYQPGAIQFIEDRKYCALWVGMRLGKSICVLTALQNLRDRGEVRRVLIVAPKRVSINSWPEDLVQWSHLDLSWTLIRGSASERKTKMRRNTTIHIINIELLPWLIDELGHDNFPYDTLVLDESRKFKNHVKKTETGNLSRFGSVCKVRPGVRRVIELTGTPAPLSYIDLWAQIYLLDGGRRLGKNITAFRTDYCNAGRNHYQWYLQSDAQERIRDKIRDLIFVVPPEDEIDLPDVVFNPVNVELTDQARKRYNEMKKDYVTELQGRKVIAFSAGSKSIKLLQIASGKIYIDKVATQVHEQKIQALIELVDLITGPKLVIYNFVFEKRWILERFPEAKLLDSNPDTIKKWNAGLIDMLVMHPASGGHGLNLYKGGDHLIWFGPTWDLELWEQTNKRLSHPSKSEGRITINCLIARSTLDSSVLISLQHKAQVQALLLADLVGFESLLK